MSAEPTRPIPRNDPAVEAAYRSVPAGLRAQIINGQLRVAPRPVPEHANAAGELFGELRGPFRLGRGGPGGWVFLFEQELHFGPRPDKLVPDLAGWRRDRVQSDTFANAAVTLSPDWVCEVLSPDTEVEDRRDKLPIYAREGVRHTWLLDPQEETLEVYRLDRGVLRQLSTWRANAVVRAEPFDAIELDLAVLWRW